ncbi:hypothetical protein [Sphingobium indicum]
MGDVTPAQTSFNGGEITPRLGDRVDQSIRSIGLKTMLGYLPLLQGPAEAAPGTLFVAWAKGPFRNIPFEFNSTQGYQIEAGDNYMRFYTNDAQIMDGDVPYEIVTPWSYEEVKALWYQQNYDALYLTHTDHPVYRLARTSADTFALEVFSPRNGPLDSRNSDKAVTVAANATTGTATITASIAMFGTGDVGGFMEIEGGDFSTIPSWEPGIKVSNGDLRQWNGRVYQAAGVDGVGWIGGSFPWATGSERTGTVAPIHIEGTEWDGMGTGKDVNDNGPYGVQWTYLYDRFGLVKFTAYVSPTQMTATVIRRLPTTDACWRWRFGSFSARRGYPSKVSLWQDRLVFGKANTVYASVSESIDDFAYRNELGDISRDMAFVRPLPNPNFIRWIVPDQALVIGTADAEHLIVAGSAGQGAGPGNLDTATPEHEGSTDARPIQIGTRVLFIEGSRTKVMQIAYDSQRMLRQESGDLCRYADHIGNAGFREIAWQKKPEKLIWAVLDDGTMAAAAYNPDELLLGWARRNLAAGLSARHVSCITDPDGRFAQVWTAVQGDARFANRWMMLRMAPIRRPGDANRNHVLLDAAVHYQGAATASISAPHLASQLVQVVADGKYYGTIRLDTNGAATLDYTASDIIVGLPFDAELETLPIEGGSEGGTAQGKKRRPYRIDVGVVASDGVEVEAAGVKERTELVQGNSPTDSALPLVTGYLKIENIGNHETSPTVKVRRYLPLPSTISAIVPYMTVSNS